MSIDDVHKRLDAITTDFSTAEIYAANVAFCLALGLAPFAAGYDWCVVLDAQHHSVCCVQAIQELFGVARTRSRAHIDTFPRLPPRVRAGCAAHVCALLVDTNVRCLVHAVRDMKEAFKKSNDATSGDRLAQLFLVAHASSWK
jgi:hypothetical protein